MQLKNEKEVLKILLSLTKNFNNSQDIVFAKMLAIYSLEPEVNDTIYFFNDDRGNLDEYVVLSFESLSKEEENQIIETLIKIDRMERGEALKEILDLAEYQDGNERIETLIEIAKRR